MYRYGWLKGMDFLDSMVVASELRADHLASSLMRHVETSQAYGALRPPC